MMADNEHIPGGKKMLACWFTVFWAWCVLALVVLPPFMVSLQESFEVACPLCQRREDNSHSLRCSWAKGNMKGCAGSEQASLAGVPCRGSFWPSEMQEVPRSSGDLTRHCNAGLSDIQTEGICQAQSTFSILVKRNFFLTFRIFKI